MALRTDQDRGERQHHAQRVRFPIFLPCLVLQEVCFARVWSRTQCAAACIELRKVCYAMLYP